MEKIVISVDEFEKKVEIELEHLVYFDRLNKPAARREAEKVIGEKYKYEPKVK